MSDVSDHAGEISSYPGSLLSYLSLRIVDQTGIDFGALVRTLATLDIFIGRFEKYSNTSTKITN